MAESPPDLNRFLQEENRKFAAAKEEMAKVIVGQDNMIARLFIALLSDGHVLIEGLPGLAKTLAVTTLARVIKSDYKRIQFTPDLLPADLTGTTIYNPKEGTFSVKKGPIFTNVLLADEINRAPAKVQSALLEVMQERQVTIGGDTFQTGSPYIVLATQNPVEQEGTYPLPEAQTDRFMLKIKIDYPTRLEEQKILERMGTLGPRPEATPTLSGDEILYARDIVNQIYIDDKVVGYILDLIFATRQPKDFQVNIDKLLMFGASPRATIALKMASKAHAFLEGRNYVTPHDVKQIAPDVLRHRLRLSFEAEAEEITSDDIVEMLLKTIPVP